LEKAKITYAELVAKSTEDIVKELAGDSNKGLASQEASQRLEKFGLNQLEGKKERTPLSIFLDQFKDLSSGF